MSLTGWSMRERRLVAWETAEGVLACGIETLRTRLAGSRMKHGLRVSNCNDT